MKTKIAVIGSGASGLAAVKALTEYYSDNVEIVVFEKNAEVGGKSSSVKVGDKIYELGSGLILPSPFNTPFHRALAESEVTLENARLHKRPIVYYLKLKNFKTTRQYSYCTRSSYLEATRFFYDAARFIFHHLFLT